MRIEITVPVSHSGKIVADLANRRSHLQEVSERSGVRLIRSLTPLAHLVDYASVLRSLSSGSASLSILFHSYRRMTESERRVAAEQVTGFAIP